MIIQVSSNKGVELDNMIKIGDLRKKILTNFYYKNLILLIDIYPYVFNIFWRKDKSFLYSRNYLYYNIFKKKFNKRDYFYISL